MWPWRGFWHSGDFLMAKGTRVADIHGLFLRKKR